MSGESAGLEEFVRRESAPLLAYLLSPGLRYHDAETPLPRHSAAPADSDHTSRTREHGPAPQRYTSPSTRSRRQRSDQRKQQRCGAAPATTAAADELPMLKEEQRALRLRDCCEPPGETDTPGGSAARMERA